MLTSIKTAQKTNFALVVQSQLYEYFPVK